MAYVNVDVDLEDFETYELCEEVIKRLKALRKGQVTTKQKVEIKEAITDLAAKIGIGINGNFSNSLDDKLKMEFISSIWDKYTYYELEEKLK